jgi:hypothetical protein
MTTAFGQLLEAHREFCHFAAFLAHHKVTGTTHGVVGYLMKDGEYFNGLKWEFSSVVPNPNYLFGDEDDPYCVKLENIKIGHQTKIGNA